MKNKDINKNEPLSYFRNFVFHPNKNNTGIVLRLVREFDRIEDILAQEESVCLAQIDGYAIIPIEDYHALNIFDQLRALDKQVSDGQISE